jgi:hypothetical protein
MRMTSAFVDSHGLPRLGFSFETWASSSSARRFSFGRKIGELLLGGGIEEFDRESRHLQAELRWIESSLVSDISQLGSLAGVFGQSLADLLRSDQLVQSLGQPLVPLVREDHALGLAMGTEDDRLTCPLCSRKSFK